MVVKLGQLVNKTLAVLWAGVVAKVIPDYIYICKAGHAQYSECLQKTIRPHLARGKVLHVPALEPIVFPEVELKAGLENISGKVTMTNVRAFGCSSFVVNSLKVDPVGLSAKVSVTFPALSGEGEYDVDGRLLSLTLKTNGVASGSFTSYVQVCRTSDPGYTDCVLKSVENIRPRLLKGIPKMLVPSLEPFLMAELEVNRDLQAARFKLRASNIRAHGGSAFVVNSLEADPIGLKVAVNLTLPRLFVEADYDVDGHIIVVPVRGKGAFTALISNVEAVVQVAGKTAESNGITHLQTESVSSRIRVLGDIKIRAVASKEEYAGMTETAVSFFNQNRREVLEILYPVIEETADEIIAQMADKIAGRIPVEEILPK